MKNKKFNFAVLGLAIIALCLASGRIYLNLTDGFTLDNITSEFAFRSSETDLPIASNDLKKINEILSQPFNYLGRGAQIYAFKSADGNYVLKIVKQKHLKIPLWTQFFLKLPGLENYGEKKVEKYRKRILSFLKCCDLAYNGLKEESGLIYMHLNRTQGLHPTVTIYDKLNKSYQLPLDDFEFLIQVRGRLIYPSLANLIQENPPLAYEMLEKLIHKMIIRSQKGIIDKDTPKKFGENVGFVNAEPIFIDFGEFSKSELIRYPVYYKAYIRLQTQHLHEWLRNQDEELAEKFNDLIEKINR